MDIGDKIIHQEFGEGVITYCYNEDKYAVKFNNHEDIKVLNKRSIKVNLDNAENKTLHPNISNYSDSLQIKENDSVTDYESLKKTIEKDEKNIMENIIDYEKIKEIFISVLNDELAFGNVEIGTKWNNGKLLFQPADQNLKPKEIPIETFFHKIVLVRDRLRVLEQHINSHSVLSDAEKVDLQQYITKCYGSLTTFNVLFKNKEDYFIGEGK